MIFNFFQHCMKPAGNDEKDSSENNYLLGGGGGGVVIDGLWVATDDEKGGSATTTPTEKFALDHETHHRLFNIVASSDDGDEIWVPDIASSEYDDYHIPPMERTLFSNDEYNVQNKKIALNDNGKTPPRTTTCTEVEPSDPDVHVSVPCRETGSTRAVDTPEAISDGKSRKEETDENITSDLAAKHFTNEPVETPETSTDDGSPSNEDENFVPCITPQKRSQSLQTKEDEESKMGDRDNNYVPALPNDTPDRKVIVTEDSVIVITKNKVLVAKKPTTPGEKAQIVEMKRTPTKKRKSSKRSSKRRGSSMLENHSSSSTATTAPMLSPNKVLLLESQNKNLLGAMQY